MTPKFIAPADPAAQWTGALQSEAAFDLKSDWLVADTAYGAAPNLHVLVEEKNIAPHIPVIDKSQRNDGTFSREDFTYDDARDCYVCPNGKVLPRPRGVPGVSVEVEVLPKIAEPETDPTHTRSVAPRRRRSPC